MQPIAQIMGPGGGMPPSTLDGFSQREAALIQQILASGKYPGLSYKSFYGERLYDTARVASGTALPAGEFPMFAVPIGSQTTEFNTTTTYTKTKIDTNMKTARQLPQGQFAWITSIQCRVVVVGSLDDSVQTGNNVGLANAPGTGASLVAADDVVAVTLAQAAYESIVGTFNYNSTDFESAPLWGFPSRYGISGVSGGGLYSLGTTGPGIYQNETVLNNGFGFAWILPVVRQIDSLYQFSFNLQALNPFTPSRNFRINVVLEGLGAKSVTG